jgi:hypothetical protein
MVTVERSLHQIELEKNGWSLLTVKSIGGPCDKSKTDEELRERYMHTGRFRDVHTEQTSSVLDKSGRRLLNPNYREVYVR